MLKHNDSKKSSKATDILSQTTTLPSPWMATSLINYRDQGLARIRMSKSGEKWNEQLVNDAFYTVAIVCRSGFVW